jgi:tRNA(Ile2) C34 agmatinyltransferase TiaS
VRVYVGFDDTDNYESDYGTGKLTRHFEKVLPEECSLWGVVRQQLLVDDRIPYTSHNSSACAVVETADSSPMDQIINQAVDHVEKHSAEGSDPGLCVVREGNPVLDHLINFGRSCTARIMTQQDILKIANGTHLSGHGGTNDGIIGAAAAVGLTVSGWSGRFIEYGGLRDFPEKTTVKEIEDFGIHVISLDRNAMVPDLDDTIYTKGWLRPRLWGSRPILPVLPTGEKVWESMGEKRSKKKTIKKGGK